MQNPLRVDRLPPLSDVARPQLSLPSGPCDFPGVALVVGVVGIRSRSLRYHAVAGVGPLVLDHVVTVGGCRHSGSEASSGPL